MKTLSVILLSLLSWANTAEATSKADGLTRFGKVAPSLSATRAPASILTSPNSESCGYEGGLVSCKTEQTPDLHAPIRLNR